MTNLKPGTKYFYKVVRKSSQGVLQGRIHNFVTQREPGSIFRFAVIADTHILGGPKQTPHYNRFVDSVNRLAEEDIDFLIFVGDEACLDGSGVKGVTPRKTLSQEEASARYAQMRRLYEPLLASRPGFLALGNHDGECLFKATVLGYNHSYIAYWMRWGAVARKRYFLNPQPDTYPEGGENEGWRGPEEDPALGGAAEGHASPLENYFAWSWGDALFVVLDPFRYTGPESPSSPEDWTLGEAQMEWLERTLKESDLRHKFVVAHHLVGGAPYSADCTSWGGYGRGGAAHAHLGEQRRIHKLMRRHGARFFLYGHDHIFSHTHRNSVQYICCGRLARIYNNWWETEAWREMYGEDFIGVAGYTLFEVSPNAVKVCYRISGVTNPLNTHWDGRSYPLRSDNSVEVERTVGGVVRVWSPADPSKRNLFPGGSYEGRTIRLGKKPKGRTDSVRVIYIGQDAYARVFRRR